MQLNSFVPETDFCKFKCSLCENYLSYFPIYVIIDNDNLNICGRCSLPEGKTCFQNKIYETMAQYIKFPCRYENKGCTECLLPKEVAFHEKNCFFKNVSCPGMDLTGCNWKGFRTCMLAHCREQHEDMFLKPSESFTVDSKGIIKFVEYDGALFIVCIEIIIGDNLLKCSIYHVREDNIDVLNYSYQLILTKSMLNVMVECVTTSFDEKKNCEIVLDTFKNHTEIFPIFGKIVFEKTIDDIVSAKNSINKNLLSLLVCSVCGEFALPPIYEFNKNVRCTDCRLEGGISISDPVRNLNLDNIAELLDYPCRYMKNGCSVVLKAEKMQKHKLICTFQNDICPLSYLDSSQCEWSGLIKDLKLHIQENHQNMILKNGQLIIDFYVGNNTYVKLRIIEFGSYLFVLRCRTDFVGVINSDRQRVFTWEVYKVGNNANNFKFQVEVTNFSRDNQMMLIKRKCLPLSKQVSLTSQVKSDSQEECICNEDQIFPLLRKIRTSNKFYLKFKVNIFQQ